METRDSIQQKALELSRKHDHILLTWATGCGKSLAALKCMVATGGMWIIVCKEITHIENWKRDIEKHGMSWMLRNKDASFADAFRDDNRYIIWDIICYASLHKYEYAKEANLVLDEVHGLSELRELRIGDMLPGKIVSLSATVDEEIKQRLSSIKPFEEYNITTSSAIEMGILPEPKVYLVHKELDDSRREYVAKVNKKEVKLTAKGYYDHLTRNFEYWKTRFEEKGESWAHPKQMQAALDRKRWMAEYKTDLAETVLEKIKDRRFICFTGGIDQCNKLGGTNVVHSKISTKKREELITNLNNEVINSLFCVNMMRESINITNIEAGMIVQLDGVNDRSFIQTLGRTLRGEKPEFYVLYIKGTQDERYVKTAFKDFNPKYIHILNN